MFYKQKNKYLQIAFFYRFLLIQPMQKGDFCQTAGHLKLIHSFLNLSDFKDSNKEASACIILTE